MSTLHGLYCVPGAIPSVSRDEHFRRLKRLFSQALTRLESADSGYVYYFGDEEIEEVARFVSHERHCCPFLEFNLVIRPGASQAELRVSGPPGTEEFLEAEFGHSRPS
jgi:hypothetical protein